MPPARSRFHIHLERLQMSPAAAGSFRDALIDVCDTAEGCHAWLLDTGLPVTAADVVALTALVMAEHTRVAARDAQADEVS